MKMVIVDIRGNTAVALQEDGRFIKLHCVQYRIGQTIDNDSAPKNVHRFPRMAVACFVAVLILTQAALAVCVPYSYVTLDVNPSIQYTLNVFDRVLSVSAVNEDAANTVMFLKENGISLSEIDDVIQETVVQLRTEGYLSQNEQDYLVLSVASESDNRTKKLSDQLECYSETDNLISAEVVSTTIREIKEAQQEGTTPGKLALINEMQKKTGDTKSAQAWIDRPVREIMLAMSGNGATSQRRGSDQSVLYDGKKGTSAPKVAEKSGETAPERFQSLAGPSTDLPASKSDKPFSGQTDTASGGEADTGTPPQQDAAMKPDTAGTGASTGGSTKEDAISALSEEHRSILDSYSSAYEVAVAAEQAAATDGSSGEDLTPYHEASLAALAQLQQAAKTNGIEFGTTPGERMPGALGTSVSTPQGMNDGSAAIPGNVSKAHESAPN